MRFAPHRVQKSRYLEYVEKSTDFRDHHLHDAPTPYRRYLSDGCTTSTNLVSKVKNNYLSRYGAFGRYVIAANSRDIVLSECGLLPRGSVARFRLTGMCSLHPFCPRFAIWTRQRVDRKIPVYFGGLRLGRCFDFHCRNRKWRAVIHRPPFPLECLCSYWRSLPQLHAPAFHSATWRESARRGAHLLGVRPRM